MAYVAIGLIQIDLVEIQSQMHVVIIWDVTGWRQLQI